MTVLIGTAPDQVPITGMLGKLAFLSADAPHSNALATTQTAPTIASATTITPNTYISFVSGTTAIVTITVPTNLLTTGGQLVLIPTGSFTTVTTGNIALASTAVIGKALILIYDATTAKWYPSY